MNKFLQDVRRILSATALATVFFGTLPAVASAQNVTTEIPSFDIKITTSDRWTHRVVNSNSDRFAVLIQDKRGLQNASVSMHNVTAVLEKHTDEDAKRAALGHHVEDYFKREMESIQSASKSRMPHVQHATTNIVAGQFTLNGIHGWVFTQGLTLNGMVFTISRRYLPVKRSFDGQVALLQVGTMNTGGSRLDPDSSDVRALLGGVQIPAQP